MKKVTTPSAKEEAVYYSDFSGKCFGEFGPTVTLTLEFNYGSKRDGAYLRLDLTDEEVQEIIELIKSKLNSATKDELKNLCRKAENEYADACDFRDWYSADTIYNSIDLYNYLTDTKET